MKKLMYFLLATLAPIACSEISSGPSDGNRLWSDTPAFTSVMEYSRELGGTSDIDDGLFEGDARPSLPRVTRPSATVSRWHSGEGFDYLHEETGEATRGKYPNPVRLWESEPYPIGNGRLAASVFNGSGRDRYALNEVSFWSGGRNGGTINSKGDKSFDGEAGPDAGEEEFGGSQPIGDLIVDFGSAVERGTFKREILFNEGEVHSLGTRKGVTIESRSFASHPDQVIAISYNADKKCGLNVRITMALQRETDLISTDKDAINFKSCLKNGIECYMKALVKNQGGSLIQGDNFIDVKDADGITILISAATNYVMDYSKNFREGNAEMIAEKYLRAIEDVGFAELEERHKKDYLSLFDRVKLSLSASEDSLKRLPTPTRLERYRTSRSDNGLEETIFNFGRYLMICTSRPGSLPAGLQGIWNGHKEAPWGNDMHSNINFQMVYWLPEVANLSDCHLSMIDYLYAMREPDRLATKEYLSAVGEDTTDVKGWLVYTSHNQFGGQGWRINLTGSAWYGLHLWEHFDFTQDTLYLKNKGYPMLKELSQFWMHHLKALGDGGEGFVSNYVPVDVSLYPELADIPAGTLVVPIGWSPEHGPRGEDGVSYDQEIVLELFRNTIKAAKVLDADQAMVDSLESICQRMYFPRIGAKGNLMEWMVDRDPETIHRHTSHLFAVYPGSTISVDGTPDLAEAARKSLLFRKNEGESRTSWAWTWRSILWARLRDGYKAHEMMEGLISYNMLDNLLTSHKIPQQIDGNYGIAATMIEMLVQSQDGEITLLPAVSDKWPSGSISGIKARGNIEISFSWKNGRVKSWELVSPEEKEIMLNYNGRSRTILTVRRD